LVGSTELGYRYRPHKSRMGDFFPTELGEKLMPAATGLSPAGIELGRISRAMDRSACDDTESGEAKLDRLRRTTEYADYAAAAARSEALDLELRGPDGSVIATEWIAIQDTEFLLSLAGEPFDDDWQSDYTQPFDPQQEAALEKAIEADRALLDEIQDGLDENHAWDDPVDSGFPRYQIHVHLVDNRSVL
jgi:hypothetical protein